jgi:hypothetical protein
MTARTAAPSLLPLLAALATVACGPEFTPPMEVTGLRVLAVRAEPPEVAPPGDSSAPSRAELGALVAHPGFAGDAVRRATVLHLACTPAPGSAGANPCTVLTTLADPTALFPYVDLELACSAPGLGAAGGITFAGLEACGATGCAPVTVLRDPADAGSEVTLPAPAYQVPAEASLAGLPEGDPSRVLGLEVVIVSMALDLGPDELAPDTAVPDSCTALGTVAHRFGERWGSAASETAVKRILLRGPDALSPANSNPPLTGIALAGSPLPAPGQAPTAIPGGAQADLLPLLPGDPDALAETWIEVDGNGTPIGERQEEWTYAWFTTAGELADPYTRTATDPAKLTAPGTGPLLVWLVVRDLRGGMAWSAGALVAGE